MKSFQTLILILLAAVLFPATGTGEQHETLNSGFYRFLRLSNEAEDAQSLSITDLDGDMTYGPRGFEEDADDRWDGERHGHGAGTRGGNPTRKQVEPEVRKPEAEEEPAVTPAVVEPKDLPIYGSELFSRANRSSAGEGRATTDPSYRLRSGDNLRLALWDGATVDDARVTTVDAEGRIDLPGLAPVEVAGRTLADARAAILAEARKFYRQVQVTANVEERRPIEVVVAGNVERPGVQLLSAGATLLTALDACGGPSDIGSYREIRVRRGDETFTADLYMLLNEGDRSWDFPLQSGDTLFVPKRGLQVRLGGAVKKPAYYEVKPGTAMGELLGWAGLLGSSFTQYVDCERFSAGRERLVFTFHRDYWDDPKYGLLYEGDRIEVRTISDLVTNPVYLKGNVERTGRFQWREGMKVSELLEMGGALLEDTDFTRANLRRRMETAAEFGYGGGSISTPQEGRLIALNLAAVLRGEVAHDIALQPHDELVVFNVRAVRPAPMATVGGEVFKPGTFEIREGMRLSDLVHAAGGFKPEANLGTCEIMRREFVGFDAEAAYRIRRISVDLAAILEGRRELDPLLANYDVVRIDRVADYLVRVRISGSVKAPGEYVLTKGARIGDLLEQADGLLATAYPRGARFFRESVREKQEETKKRFVAEQKARLRTLLAESVSETEYKSKRYGLAMRTYEDLLGQLEATPARGRIAVALDRPGFESTYSNLVLMDGDTLVIPERPSEVSIEGHVFSGGSVVWEPGRQLDGYLAAAGGLADGADRKNVYVFKADGTSVRVGLHKKSKAVFGLFSKLRLGSRSARGSDDRHPATGIEPGDIIFVAPEYDLKDDWNLARGIVDVVFKTAVTAGVITSIGL